MSRLGAEQKKGGERRFGFSQNREKKKKKVWEDLFLVGGEVTTKAREQTSLRGWSFLSRGISREKRRFKSGGDLRWCEKEKHILVLPFSLPLVAFSEVWPSCPSVHLLESFFAV